MSLGDVGIERRGPGRPPKDRDAVRPPVRDDRLAARIAEIRGNAVAADDGTDAFFIPPDVIPDGWSYEWKREETIGKTDDQHQMFIKRRGWEPVPQSRHPDIMVRQQGMILMERPAEITRESFINNQVLARQQISAKEAQLNGGDDLAEGTEVATRKTMVKRTIEHHPIPD